MSRQAVLVKFFNYSRRFPEDLRRDRRPLFELEDVLATCLEVEPVGEVDGYNVALDGSNGTFYLYGPDAWALFRVVEPVLRASRVTYDAEVTLRFGVAGDPAALEEIVQLSGPEPRLQ